MALSSIEQYGNVQADVQVSVPTSATLLKTLLANASAGAGGPYAIPALAAYAFSLTNNDPANAVYVGFSPNLASTRAYAKLAADGGSIRLNAGPGVLSKVYVLAVSAACNLDVVVFG